jgi:hypothetical protein
VPCAPQVTPADGLQADFFQRSTECRAVQEPKPCKEGGQQRQWRPRLPTPSACHQKTSEVPGESETFATGSSIPKGFFDDEEADGRAHGQKPKTKKQLDAEFEQFQREVDDIEKEKAEAEVAEVEEAEGRQAALEQWNLRCTPPPA